MPRCQFRMLCPFFAICNVRFAERFARIYACIPLLTSETQLAKLSHSRGAEKIFAFNPG